MATKTYSIIVRRLVWAAALSAGVLLQIGSAGAESATKYWPEINGFFNLGERARLMLLASDEFLEETNKSGGSKESRTPQAGVNLDYTLKPVLRTALRDEDWERDRYLWMRIGYTYLGNSDGWSNGENRGILELNAREPLADGLWLTNRLKWDMRDVDGDYSNRYRVRLGMEKEFIVAGRKWVPYVDAESYYDTRYDYWNRQYYRSGVEIVASNRWRIEPYVGYQYDNSSGPEHIYVLGLILKYTR
jgi:hypothetical protein